MATRKKIIKNLYSKLKESQADDAPLPSPTLVEIKFYLKRHKRCRQIWLENDPEPLDPLALPSQDIPQFILSQLQAQNIADKPRHSVQISTILAVLSEDLARTPTEGRPVPTLFLWHSSGGDKRRTYCIFAHLTRSMESRTYSAEELLELRSSENHQTLLKMLKVNPEIGDVVKGKGNMPPAQARRLKKPKEDPSSSTESEEIIFQGNQAKKQPQQGIGEDMQWKYRGRSASEVTSSEPLSAPTGLAAQQSEGFQRFFKAVVSPTHVRVTAGGRIVPNTRNSASPMAKWDKDRSAPEGQESAEAIKEAKPEPAPGINHQAPPPMISPIYPGHPAFFQHMGMPMPLYHPMQNGFPFAYGYPPLQPHVAQSGPSQFESSQSQQNAGMASTGTKTEGGTSDKLAAAPVRISPPENFDQNRPFFYNGQVLYPPMGSAPPQMPPMMPVPYFQHGMVGNPAFAVPRMPSMSQSSAAPMPNLHGPQPVHFGAVQGAGGPPQLSQPPVGPKGGLAPPITSIKPSDITKRQLDSLRSSLRYYEDQLQYNKHQIDEKWTQEQAHKIKQNIAQFEHNYKMQLSFEATYYPRSEQGIAAESTFCKTPSRPSSIKGNHASESSQHGSIRSNGHAASLRHLQSFDRVSTRSNPIRNKSAVGINSSKGNDTSAQLDAVEAHIMRKMEAEAAEEAKKASLPSGAAMAPPFRPGPTTGSVPKPMPNGWNPSNNMGMSGGFPGGYNPGQWQSSGVPAQTQRGSWETAQSASTYFTNASTPAEAGTTSTDISGQSGYTVPYLVGSLPQGMNPYSARGTDYVYSRELTDEEKRARHVYWGQVSSKGLGLPKFDGKDFYPPSPVKASEESGQAPKVRTRQIPTGRPEADYSFQLKASENDPFRSSRDAVSIRSHESGPKFSKAIPIVAPDDSGRQGSKTSTNDGAGKADKTKSASGKSTGEPVSDKKSASLSRRALERSSNKSGHELWQTMLKKGSGSTSGNALPSAVSATTATAYLPQFFGHAASSLSPAVLNTNSSPARSGTASQDKPGEVDISLPAAQKVGENCPPSSAPSLEYDATKDLHERMLRDAERRGVIGSDWQ
ncbi:Uu.00g074200.m01.CDS01 [Anthostomella pinea]|uniref:Uu.00g074200.m01.CDS01 n=1 Tax=Anthostomella pinea TaxID=933095 RepID=A0AAI8YP26_9PEZI|nr:Uu.00g074200.m01.CDS01 [Anthostomella pinea]